MGVSERERAEQLLRVPTRKSDLALAFDESRAATAEVHVDGRGFFPPILADIGTAASSVHINQFGFRPGTIGEAFADGAARQGGRGRPRQACRGRAGLTARRRAASSTSRLLAGGVDVRVVRATRLRARSQPAAAGGPRAGA